MPIIQSAKKRVTVTARQTAENQLHRARSRTAMKRVRDLLAEGKADEAKQQFVAAQKFLDKAAKKRAFHPNAVARYKSNLAAALKAGPKAAPAKAKAKPAVKKTAPKKATPNKPAPKAADTPTKKKSAKE